MLVQRFSLYQETTILQGQRIHIFGLQTGGEPCGDSRLSGLWELGGAKTVGRKRLYAWRFTFLFPGLLKAIETSLSTKAMFWSGFARTCRMLLHRGRDGSR